MDKETDRQANTPPPPPPQSWKLTICGVADNANIITMICVSFRTEYVEAIY